jgi:hypothetical protein
MMKNEHPILNNAHYWNGGKSCRPMVEVKRSGENGNGQGERR